MAAPASKPQNSAPTPPSRAKRRLFLAGFAVVLLVAVGASLWVAWTQWLRAQEEPAHEPTTQAEASDLLPPVDAVYLPVPEIVAVLADPPHLARLSLLLECTPGGKTAQPSEADLQRVAEEIRRWLASQRFETLSGAVALWTTRARVLAIARDVLPQSRIRDVLVRVFLLQ
jgi:flagellar basal body-associated protein FliL